MHENVGALEQRPEVGTGHVDEVELEALGPEARFPHVEAHEPVDGRRPGQSAEHGLPEEPRHARDHHRPRGMGGVPPPQGGGSRSGQRRT